MACLTGGESVHLADWPYVADEKTGEATELGRVLVDDPALVDAMEKVREIVSGTLSLRKAAQIRVRQPLAKLTVVVEDVDAVKAYDEILKSELNIKDIEFCTMEDCRFAGLKIVHELKVTPAPPARASASRSSSPSRRPRPVPGTSMPRPVLRSSRRRTARLRWRPANTS